MIEDGTILGCGHEKVGAVGYVIRHNSTTICSPCNRQQKKDAYRPEVLRRERRNLYDCIGCSTSVGVMGFATVVGPCPKCSHDHVADPKCTRWGDGVRAECAVNECGAQLPVRDPFPMQHGNCCDILNMYTENANHIIKTMPDVAADCEVEIVELGGRERVRVIDARIPIGYKRHVCSTCKVYEDGVTPELPPVVSPSVPPADGIEVISFGGPSRKLNATWSQEGISEFL